MYTVGEVFETLGQVGQARAGGIEVGGVDLRQITQADDFGAGAGAGNDGLDLMWRQVLAFIDQNEALLEAAATDVVQ